MIIAKGFRGLWYIYFFRFLLLFSAIIPISLRVNLDMAKTLYSFLIMRDKVTYSRQPSAFFFLPSLIYCLLPA